MAKYGETLRLRGDKATLEALRVIMEFEDRNLSDAARWAIKRTAEWLRAERIYRRQPAEQEGDRDRAD